MGVSTHVKKVHIKSAVVVKSHCVLVIRVKYLNQVCSAEVNCVCLKVFKEETRGGSASRCTRPVQSDGKSIVILRGSAGPKWLQINSVGAQRWSPGPHVHTVSLLAWFFTCYQRGECRRGQIEKSKAVNTCFEGFVKQILEQANIRNGLDTQRIRQVE